MKRTSLATLRDEMRAVARGERKPSPRPAAPLFAALSPTALELIEAIIRDQPRTVAELAQSVGRAQSNVSRTLQQLTHHGIVRLVRDGREVRPEAVSKSIVVDLASGTYENAEEPTI